MYNLCSSYIGKFKIDLHFHLCMAHRENPIHKNSNVGMAWSKLKMSTQKSKDFQTLVCITSFQDTSDAFFHFAKNILWVCTYTSEWLLAFYLANIFFLVYFHLYSFYFIRFAYFQAWACVIATSKLFSIKCTVQFCTASKAGLKLVCVCVFVCEQWKLCSRIIIALQFDRLEYMFVQNPFGSIFLFCSFSFYFVAFAVVVVVFILLLMPVILMT